MSSLMSELLFSPAPKVSSPGSPLGGVEASDQGGDSFRKSFEQETRTRSRAEDRSSVSESRNENRADKRDAVAGNKKSDETQAKAPVEGREPIQKESKTAGEESVEESAEDKSPEEAVVQASTVAPAADALMVSSEPATPLKAGTVSAEHVELAKTADAKAAPVNTRPAVGLNLSRKSTGAEPASPGGLAEQVGVLKAVGQTASEAKTGELASTLAGQSASKPAEVAAVVPRAFPLNMQASTGSKGFKLDAWQFGQIEAGARVPAAELTDVSVKTPSPSAFHSTMANVINGSVADVSSARMQVPVNISFGQPQWANMVAERSAWLFSQNINSAELVLDPPELGRMTVQIQVHSQDQASVTFTSANANVRDALDQSSQRLRELLSEQGMNLVNVDVSDRQPADDQRESGTGRGGALLSADEGDAVQDEPAAAMQISLNTGVDYYV